MYKYHAHQYRLEVEYQRTDEKPKKSIYDLGD